MSIQSIVRISVAKHATRNTSGAYFLASGDLDLVAAEIEAKVKQELKLSSEVGKDIMKHSINLPKPKPIAKWKG